MYTMCEYCQSRTDGQAFCSIKCKHKKNGGNETSAKQEVNKIVMRILSQSRLGQSAAIIAANGK